MSWRGIRNGRSPCCETLSFRSENRTLGIESKGPASLDQADNDPRRSTRRRSPEGAFDMKTDRRSTLLALAASLAVAGSAIAGNVTGTVKYAGTAPAPKKIEKTKDAEVCGKEADTAED